MIMSSIHTYFCDSCGEEDPKAVVASFKSGAGYEVNFSLCRGCKVKVFTKFVAGLKGWDRLEENFERVK